MTKRTEMLEERLDNLSEVAMAMVTGTIMVQMALKDLQAAEMQTVQIGPILSLMEGLSTTFSGVLKDAEIFKKAYDLVVAGEQPVQAKVDSDRTPIRGFSA